MDSLKWALLVVYLCYKVDATEASSWTVTMPSSVEGLLGSCVVIPCSFNYPQPQRADSQFTGMWMDTSNQLIYHPLSSKIMQQYRNRTKIVGDVRQKTCKLMIDPLQEHDKGPYLFRIEIADFDNYSYKDKTVSIVVKHSPNPIDFSVQTQNHRVSASCSVFHSCPESPPVFSWTHAGDTYQHQQEHKNGLWMTTSNLTFNPLSSDHNKSLTCTVKYKGGQTRQASKVLDIKYAPVNVTIHYKPDIVEGESVKLRCSSVAHPPSSTYEWHSETGTKLHQGKTFTLPNVTRHNTGAIYCTAINTVGRGKSSLVKISVLYAPEVRTASSCSLLVNVIKCTCIVESKPPSVVHFVLSDRILPSTTTEKHDYVTISTLEAELGSSESVVCVANNTQGSASHKLLLPENSKMLNVSMIIAIGVGLILIVIVAVGIAKKWGSSRDRSPSSTMGTGKEVDLPQYSAGAAAASKETNYDDTCHPNTYASDPVYGNMEDDWDEAIYANM
ncbi:uncharacterized protein V6R79_019132 [Siganus canaliculatus]